MLDRHRTDESCHKSCSLLFWTIIAVAARQMALEEGFLTKLVPELSQLLWTTIGTSLYTLPVVQALCLLATWPLPNTHMWTDKSLVLSQMAMASAVIMGMHRPGCEREYSKGVVNHTYEDIVERSRTWIASATACQRQEITLNRKTFFRRVLPR